MIGQGPQYKYFFDIIDAGTLKEFRAKLPNPGGIVHASYIRIGTRHRFCFQCDDIRAHFQRIAEMDGLNVLERGQGVGAECGDMSNVPHDGG